jgi:hypothetical protein
MNPAHLIAMVLGVHLLEAHQTPWLQSLAFALSKKVKRDCGKNLLRMSFGLLTLISFVCVIRQHQNMYWEVDNVGLHWLVKSSHPADSSLW